VNLETLFQFLLPKNTIQEIKYFTALVSARPNDPSQPQRQQLYLRALATLPKVSVGTSSAPDAFRWLIFARPPLRSFPLKRCKLDLLRFTGNFNTIHGHSSCYASGADIPMTSSSLHSDPTRAEIRQSRVARRLEIAIASGSLRVHYQPEASINPLSLVSFEALCRWQDSELNLVTPDEFIAVAEARGLIIALGEEIWRLVLNDLPALLQRWPHARVAINVSGLELAQPDYASKVLAAIHARGPQLAQHLELEVTESIFHTDLTTVRQNLLDLKAQGLTVAIDDFGTGQSSLSRLHTLPFDKIKMDKSFVQALEDPISQAILKAMMDLASSLQKILVVEGLETQEQSKVLQQLGCQFAQGYWLSAPKSLTELLNSLQV
jgi:EAL domain-containing protein (putative c-di-GMP-specific phosphodiesterase class I)